MLREASQKEGQTQDDHMWDRKIHSKQELAKPTEQQSCFTELSLSGDEGKR